MVSQAGAVKSQSHEDTKGSRMRVVLAGALLAPQETDFRSKSFLPQLSLLVLWPFARPPSIEEGAPRCSLQSRAPPPRGSLPPSAGLSSLGSHTHRPIYFLGRVNVKSSKRTLYTDAFSFQHNCWANGVFQSRAEWSDFGQS